MNLKHVQGRVVVSIDIEYKNQVKFENGTRIRLERQYNNLNRRETEPVNAIVIDAENIPIGAEILIHPNEIHDVNKIFDYQQLSGNEIASDIKYYSINENQCFAWRTGVKDWQPTKNFDFALRVFKPYLGVLEGIEPTLIKDTLYVTTGELKGNVVKTVKASDYEIIYQENTGKEKRLIRFRPNGDEQSQREPEAIAIMQEYTKKVNNGEYIIGINISDAKPLKEKTYA